MPVLVQGRETRVDLTLAGGGKALGIIRGKHRKRCWIGKQTVLLVSARDFEPGKVDILDKFEDAEVRGLIDLGEIPSSFQVVDGVEKEDEDVVFGDFSEEEEEIDIDVYLRLQGVV
jgi:initiation factor 1A